MAAASALAACASQQQVQVGTGRYVSYQDMGTSTAIHALRDNPAPGPVKTRFAICLAAWTATFFTPAETAMLDQYARGERRLTTGELGDLNAEFQQRSGGQLTAANVDRLGAVCPADVPAFRQYGLPPA